MGIFPFFKKKPFFTIREQEQIVEAIRNAEQQTSGEIRLYIEHKNPLVSTLERAAAIFFQLQMEKTLQRNGVLIYLATTHKEIALFADEGIYKVMGQTYWDKEVALMLEKFIQHQQCEGLVRCIHDIGQVLKEKFPYDANGDKNELPDDIIFGK